MMRNCVSEYNLTNGMPSNLGLGKLSRKKSLPRNHFRGLKKDELQKRTSMYLATMTVSCVFISTFPKNDLYKIADSLYNIL